jgi:hypothetical protein
VAIDGVWIGNRIYCILQPITTESLWTLYSWQLTTATLQPSSALRLQLCRLSSRLPWLYSLGTDPIGNTALALLSGRYQVTPSEQTAGETIAPLLNHQAHSMHVTIYIYIYIRVYTHIHQINSLTPWCRIFLENRLVNSEKKLPILTEP